MHIYTYRFNQSDIDCIQFALMHFLIVHSGTNAEGKNSWVFVAPFDAAPALCRR